MTDTATPTAPPPPPLPAAVARLVEVLERRDAVLALVEGRLHELRALSPALRLRRGVFDGAWVLGLHAGGAADPARPFSRLDFEVRIAAQVTITRRMTLRQRDAVADDVTATADAAGLQRLKAFVEEALCTFAAAFFARG